MVLSSLSSKEIVLEERKVSCFGGSVEVITENESSCLSFDVRPNHLLRDRHDTVSFFSDGVNYLLPVSESGCRDYVSLNYLLLDSLGSGVFTVDIEDDWSLVVVDGQGNSFGEPFTGQGKADVTIDFSDVVLDEGISLQLSCVDGTLSFPVITTDVIFDVPFWASSVYIDGLSGYDFECSSSSISCKGDSVYVRESTEYDLMTHVLVCQDQMTVRAFAFRQKPMPLVVSHSVCGFYPDEASGLKGVKACYPIILKSSYCRDDNTICFSFISSFMGEVFRMESELTLLTARCGDIIGSTISFSEGHETKDYPVSIQLIKRTDSRLWLLCSSDNSVAFNGSFIIVDLPQVQI